MQEYVTQLSTLNRKIPTVAYSFQNKYGSIIMYLVHFVLLVNNTLRTRNVFGHAEKSIQKNAFLTV